MRWIVFSFVYLMLTFYGLQAIRTLTKNFWVNAIFIAVALLVVINLIAQFLWSSDGRVLSPSKSYAFGFLLSFMLLNIVLVIFLLGEDMVRFLEGSYSGFFAQGK